MVQTTTLILIAEDDLDDQALLKEAFFQVVPQCKILFYRDGEFFLTALEEEPSLHCANLILLDLNMPRRGGMETLEELKQNEKWRDIPVVIFSTSRNVDDATKSLSMGANDFITKPASYDELVITAEKLAATWLKGHFEAK